MTEEERYQEYLCSREWAVLKEQVHKRSQGVCERCRYGPGYAVHHLTYIRKYHEHIEDLRHLCEQCHLFLHGKSKDDPIELWTKQNDFFYSIDIIRIAGLYKEAFGTHNRSFYVNGTHIYEAGDSSGSIVCEIPYWNPEVTKLLAKLLNFAHVASRNH